MATCHGSGYQSPPPIGRTIDRIFEDAQYTGEILLNGRKLRDYPKLCSKYDLSDTVLVDISRNRLSEVPLEVCQYLFVEKIHCYHNVIRSIPDAISQLQNLIHLILSRNQLTVLPPAVCQLTCLEVLHASNNKLVSLPEEIGQLKNLMDLDVSCNEISHLPVQIGDLPALRSLNLRNNFLVELPVEISRLQLFKLDFSSNRIEKIPAVFRKMESLEQLVLDHNPLTSPPAYICTKGRQHIMKYLHMEAVREDRKRGIMMGSDSDMKRYIRKSLPVHQSTDDFKTMLDAPESKWKRHTVLSNDSGYSTADGSEKNGWQSGEIYSHEESTHLTDTVRNYVRERETPHHMQSLHGDKQILSYHYSHGTPHTSASISNLNLNHSARSRSGSGLFQQQSVPPAKQEPGHYDASRSSQAWPMTQGTSQQLLYHQPHLQPGSPYPSHRGIHQPPPVSSSYSTSSVHSSLSYVTSVASTLSSLSATVSVTNTYNPLRSVTSAGSPANSTNHLIPHRTTHTPSSTRSFDSVASMSGTGSESNLSVSSIRSSTPQASIHNNSFNGSDQSAAPQPQRSNSTLSSLSGHQPKQATGLTNHQPKQTNSLGYTARQLPSPQVSAKFRSESPSTYSQSKFAGDYSGRNSVTSIPFSSYSAASAMSQRERWLGDRNSYSARHWQEQAVSEDQLSSPSADSITPSSDIEDEFTRELKRQKADYEKKKKQAEMIRVQQEQEEEEEKDERRRAARRLQEEQRMLMERQGQQTRPRELSSQEEARRQGEPKIQDSKQLANGVGHLGPTQDYKKLPEGGTDHNNDNFPLDEEPNRRADLKLVEKNNVINKNMISSHSFKEQRRLANGIQYRRTASDTFKKTGIASIVPPQTDGLQSMGNTGVPDSCQRSSTSTTPSMSPSPSPRNSVSHVPKPHLSGASTSHIGKPLSPSGSTSHLVKLSATKSSVPRAVPGPSTPAQNQAVRKAKLAGDSRSTTSSPVTARSTRTMSTGQTQASGASLQPALSQLRRSSNSSTTDDETRSKKGQTSATDIARLKPRLDEQNRKTPLQTSVTKMQKAGAGDVDGNKKLSTRSSANIYGLARGKPGVGKTLEECSSNLSTRIREEKEDVEQMDRLRQMVESRLRVTLPDNLAEALRDGVVLCHLANQIRPRSVGSIHVPSPAVPKLTLAKCRRNVDNFLDACRKIGVDQEQLCGPQDILDEKDLSRVAITVAALVAIGTNPRTSAV